MKPKAVISPQDLRKALVAVKLAIEEQLATGKVPRPVATLRLARVYGSRTTSSPHLAAAMRCIRFTAFKEILGADAL